MSTISTYMVYVALNSTKCQVGFNGFNTEGWVQESGRQRSIVECHKVQTQPHRPRCYKWCILCRCHIDAIQMHVCLVLDLYSHIYTHLLPACEQCFHVCSAQVLEWTVGKIPREKSPLINGNISFPPDTKVSAARILC